MAAHCDLWPLVMRGHCVDEELFLTDPGLSSIVVSAGPASLSVTASGRLPVHGLQLFCCPEAVDEGLLSMLSHRCNIHLEAFA